MDGLCIPGAGQYVVLDLVPGTLVAGLLLTPENLAGLAELRQLRAQRLAGKWIKLFYTQNSDVLDVSSLPFLEQTEVHFTATQYNAFDGSRVKGFGLRDDEFELPGFQIP